MDIHYRSIRQMTQSNSSVDAASALEVPLLDIIGGVQ